MTVDAPPRIVLICHDDDRIDNELIAPWLRKAFVLAGIVSVRETRSALLRRARREFRRVGLVRFLDVAAFRMYYALRLAKKDAAWIDQQLIGHRSVPADDVPRLSTSSPNTAEARDFIAAAKPDLVLARCKAILKPEIFSIPASGTWVLHPGICPEYRNAHGCFWALVRRDLQRVGMTLLRVDRGIDTGPVYLHASYDFDERRESHIVIQYRAVLENLPAVEATLLSACRGTARPLPTDGRQSAVWGQPWLSEYLSLIHI